MDLSLRVSSEYDCGSHKVYLNFWVTHFGGCDRVQIKVNISMFGWDCPSPVKPPSISQSIPPPSHQLATTKSVTPTIQIISHLEINIPASTGSVIIIVFLTIFVQLLIIILTKNN